MVNFFRSFFQVKCQCVIIANLSIFFPFKFFLKQICLASLKYYIKINIRDKQEGTNPVDSGRPQGMLVRILVSQWTYLET